MAHMHVESSLLLSDQAAKSLHLHVSRVAAEARTTLSWWMHTPQARMKA